MIVKVKQGSLEGKEETSVLTGKKLFSFMGIPYAQPPVGELRFRPPVPADKWEGVRPAKEAGSQCLQFEKLFTGPVVGTEDCLYLNVFIAEPPNENAPLKPVMVYIHGGAFCAGRGPLESDFLLEHDVVVVTFNYRLGIFGFLNLNIPECPGNVGMKDQTLALTWVKENIHSFGGDPNNVTLFGESAGASSVNLHVLSPLSKGLFRRIIAQSGCVLSPWCLTVLPEENAFKAGEKLGFSDKDPKKLVEFLREKSANDLFQTANFVTTEAKNACPAICQGLSFTPSIEKITENAFLPEHPLQLLKSVDPVPAIIGTCEKEGVLIFAGLQNPQVLESLKNDLTDAIKYNVPCDTPKIPEIAAKVKEFYLGEQAKGLDSKEQFIDLFSDIFFLRLYEAFENSVKSNVPLYAYEFKFAGKFNKSQFWLGKSQNSFHADELGYLFPYKTEFVNADYTEPETSVIRNICTLWTNFAKTGNPNTPVPVALDTEWKPDTLDRQSHLQIDKDLKVVDGKIWGKRRAFWESVL